MDSTEWIALAIVAAALLFWVRRLFSSKKGSCCDNQCKALKRKPSAAPKMESEKEPPQAL